MDAKEATHPTDEKTVNKLFFIYGGLVYTPEEWKERFNSGERQ